MCGRLGLPSWFTFFQYLIKDHLIKQEVLDQTVQQSAKMISDQILCDLHLSSIIQTTASFTIKAYYSNGIHLGEERDFI